MKLLIISYIASLYLMYANSRRDIDVSDRNPWLARHKRIWAGRDWPIIAYHVGMIPFVYGYCGYYAGLVYVLSAVLHWWAFISAYDLEAHQPRVSYLYALRKFDKPAWLKWQAWHFIPGIPVGLIFWWI